MNAESTREALNVASLAGDILMADHEPETD